MACRRRNGQPRWRRSSLNSSAPRQPANPSPFFTFWKVPLWLAAAIAVLDQLSKAYVLRNWPLGSRYAVIEGFFNLVHYRNPGAAWGILGGYTWLLTLLSFAAMLGVVVFFKNLAAGSKTLSMALGLLLGGIVGNLVDRLVHGEVVDFLDFYWGAHHWPAFNIADSAITVGVIAYILASALIPEPKEHAQ